MKPLLFRVAAPMTLFAAAFAMTACDPDTGHHHYNDHTTVVHVHPTVTKTAKARPGYPALGRRSGGSVGKVRR